MKLETLVINEFVGRFLISMTTVFVIYSVTNIWYAFLVLFLMILWILNPLFEYKMCGG